MALSHLRVYLKSSMMVNGALFVMTFLAIKTPVLSAECWDIRLALLIRTQDGVKEAEKSGWMTLNALETSSAFLIVGEDPIQENPIQLERKTVNMMKTSEFLAQAANPIHVDQGEHVLSELMIITHATVIEDIEESTVKKIWMPVSF